MMFEVRNSTQFSELIKEGVSLVAFWLPLSQPCLIQEPVLKEFSQELEGKINVIKVNTQDIPSLAQQYGVQAIPTLVLFQDNREVNRFIGVQPKDSLLEAINHLLVSKGR